MRTWLVPFLGIACGSDAQVARNMCSNADVCVDDFDYDICMNVWEPPNRGDCIGEYSVYLRCVRDRGEPGDCTRFDDWVDYRPPDDVCEDERAEWYSCNFVE